MLAPPPVDSVLHAIGHTPLVRLHRISPSGSAAIVIKLEDMNPTGSYKDRMALALIEGPRSSTRCGHSAPSSRSCRVTAAG
ncbi:MAG: pyridoxal-phosphate dependent enzyme [Acidobacteria bacterium]|nr:pyridoxal-phosphate dependent enzyme [Acidobacteriota bacterium]